MELLAKRDVADVYHADWKELLSVVPRCDALITDCPYSERTHAGHDAASNSANGNQRAESDRRALSYGAWKPSDVEQFVEAWATRVQGWFVSITDTELAPAWAAALASAGLYVFSPLACVEIGSRVRITGDGPAQWSCWAVVARPKGAAFVKWGALPGAYVCPPGHKARTMGGVVGGKPLWLMERLVEDYSRPGQLVVDPCCGAGTTVTAAIRTGRRAVGGDAMREHAELAAKAVGGMQQAPLFCGGAA